MMTQITRSAERCRSRLAETVAAHRARGGKAGGAEVQRPSWFSAANATGLVLLVQIATTEDVAGAVTLVEPMCAADAATRPDLSTTIVQRSAASIEDIEPAMGDGPGFTAVSRQFHSIMVDGSSKAVSAFRSSI